MSTVEGVQYRGEEIFYLFEYFTILNTPMVLVISITCIMISPHGTQISKDGIPHGTEHPYGTHEISPTCITISPTVLNTPTVLKISPTVLMISPTVLSTPTVLHTHYTGWSFSVLCSRSSFVLSNR